MDYKKILCKVILIAVSVSLGIFGTITYQRFTGPKQTVTISGSSEIDAPVDQATIGIQVRNTAATSPLAIEANQKDVESLKNVLLKLGIPESRITQSSYLPPIIRNVQEEDPAIESEIYMYKTRPIIVPDNNLTSTTNLTVILDNLEKIEKVYEAINGNPNTKITSTDYSLKNQKTWETKAKEEALNDARSQVESIAKINRLKVGKLVSITDDSAPQPFMGQDLMFKGAAEPSANETIETSQVNYSEQSVKIYASYTAVYELY